MTGMIVRRILLAILALLLLLLFIPLHVRVTYIQGNITVAGGIGAFQYPLFPPPVKKKGKKERSEKDKETGKKDKKSAKSKKSKKDKREEEKDICEKKEKKKPKRNYFQHVTAEQVLYSLKKLLPALGRVFKRTGRRIRIKPLKVQYLVAGPDPADTAVLYGKLLAVLEAGLPGILRILKIKEYDIQLYIDFQKTEPDCIADVGMSIRLWDILVVAAGAGVDLIAWWRGFKALAVLPEPEKTNEAVDATKDKQTGAA